jgi:hypothetical protein
MRSSISNSKRLSKRGAQALWATGVFVVFFSISFSAGLWLLNEKSPWVTTDSIPAGGWMLDQSILFQTIDQPYTTEYAFYHGIGPAISWARRADVVIVGNSRPLNGLRGKSVQEGEAQSGLSFFNLAEPRNNDVFILQLFQRQHLAPSLVLVATENFFDPKLHPTMKNTLTVSDWRAGLEVYSHSFSWFVRGFLQQWIPKLTFFRAQGVRVPREPRSAKDGFLLDSLEVPPSGPQSSLTYTPLMKVQLDPLFLSRALEFKKQMEERGSRVIFIYVPSHEDPAIVEELARETKTGCVAPHLQGMTSFDNMHLDRESAERFSKVFFEQLFRLPEVKALERKRLRRNPVQP